MYLCNAKIDKMFKKRNIFPTIEAHLSKKEFTIITGARQTGKTTILRQLYRKMQADGKEAHLISFEKEEILEQINADPENLFFYVPKPGNPLEAENAHTVYVLIDEVQYARNPSNFLKYLYDTYQPFLKIIATGSSSFYIDTKFNDSLAGRKKIFHLKTLSFDEFLLFKDATPLYKELEYVRQKPAYRSARFPDLLQLLAEYMTFGGYPDVVLATSETEKKDKLQDIIYSYIKRDIYESNIEDEVAFRNLMTMLANQIGNLLNKYNLSSTLGIHMNTLNKYIYVLQKCFHIDRMQSFHKNVKKEITKMPKVFYNDLGLRNALLNDFSSPILREDKGMLFENYVYIRLCELYEKDTIKFWRTADKNEVDFVVTETYGSGKAYEAKFNGDTIRHTKYKKFRSLYPEYPIEYISFGFAKDGEAVPVLKM